MLILLVLFKTQKPYVPENLKPCEAITLKKQTEITKTVSNSNDFTISFARKRSESKLYRTALRYRMKKIYVHTTVIRKEKYEQKRSNLITQSLYVRRGEEKHFRTGFVKWKKRNVFRAKQRGVHDEKNM